MDFQLRFLTYFLTIVEEQSFSRSAARLGISQPSLSQRIQTLETQLGFPLLIRSARGVALTPEAQRLLEPFRELVGRGNRIIRLARDVREGESRPIQLGVTMYSDRPERAELINDFLEAFQDQRIELETIYTVELYPALLSARYDVGFSVGPPPGDEFEFHVVRRFRTELLIPRESPLAARDPIALADLAGLTIVTLRAPRFPALFESALRPLADAGAELVFPSDQTPMGLLTYGRANALNIAFPIPVFSDEKLVAAGMTRRPIEGFDPPTALMLVRPKDHAHVGTSLWNFAQSWIADRSGEAA